MIRTGWSRTFAKLITVAAALAVAIPASLRADPDRGADADWWQGSAGEPVTAQQHRYEEQADDVTLPDSQIAFACCRRADIAYALGHFDTALIYYKRAMAFEKTPGLYYYKSGIAAMAKGDTGTARIFLKCVCDNDRGDLRSEAWVSLGNIAFAREKYRDAMASYAKAFPLAPGKSSWAPAVLGKLACSRKLGLKDSVTALEAQLAPFAPELLERDALEEGSESPALSPGGADAGDISFADAFEEKAPAGKAARIEKKALGAFAVIIGPYGSKKKAFAVKTRLAERFATIAVVPVTVKKLRYFAVRVGAFPTSADAEWFAHEKIESLKPKLKYRVAEKK